ncbi:hypothetical protein E8A73_003035 [Polyangium aurulentum]|nr:hypothetical protein [Polyangium aurulentum]UQA59502.1 hypothetical protein E8A73_003035 [Polyangium aurulentum]
MPPGLRVLQLELELPARLRDDPRFAPPPAEALLRRVAAAFLAASLRDAVVRELDVPPPEVEALLRRVAAAFLAASLRDVLDCELEVEFDPPEAEALLRRVAAAFLAASLRDVDVREPEAAPPFEAAFFRRVSAAFFAAALRAEAGRAAAAAPPLRPPFLAGSLFTVLPRPEPLFLPPPVILLTVAHARASAWRSGTPRAS